MRAPTPEQSRQYWDSLAARYQRQTHIALDDFHYGPLIPGDRELGLLPRPLAEQACLELGAGAGQNSLYLTSQGARCLALDGSAAQLAHGQELARQHGLSLDWRCAALEELASLGLPDQWDLIHSAYALPFVADHGAVLAAAAALLRPGGTLLISLRHPVSSGEWLQVEDDAGFFLDSYLAPPVDHRQGSGAACAQARAWPISTTIGALLAAGLRLTVLAEPAAVDLRGLSTAEARARVPYFSQPWRARNAEFLAFPPVLIIKAIRPLSPAAG